MSSDSEPDNSKIPHDLVCAFIYNILNKISGLTDQPLLRNEILRQASVLFGIGKNDIELDHTTKQPLIDTQTDDEWAEEN